MGDVKRNQWVIVLVLAAFGLMAWSGMLNYSAVINKRSAKLKDTLQPKLPINQSVAAGRMPPTRAFPISAASDGTDFQSATRDGQESFTLGLQGQGGARSTFGRPGARPARSKCHGLKPSTLSMPPRDWKFSEYSEDNLATPRQGEAGQNRRKACDINYPLSGGSMTHPSRPLWRSRFAADDLLYRPQRQGGRIHRRPAPRKTIEADIKKALAAEANRVKRFV